MKKTDHQNPFTIAYAQHPLTDNIRDDGTPVVQVHDYKRAFDSLLLAPKGISTIRGLNFVQATTPQCRYSVTGACDTDVTFLKEDQT